MAANELKPKSGFSVVPQYQKYSWSDDAYTRWQAELQEKFWENYVSERFAEQDRRYAWNYYAGVEMQKTKPQLHDDTVTLITAKGDQIKYKKD